MKRLILIAFCVCLSTVAAHALMKANFGGSSAMDKSRSEGVPPDMDKINHRGHRGKQAHLNPLCSSVSSVVNLTFDSP